MRTALYAIGPWEYTSIAHDGFAAGSPVTDRAVREQAVRPGNAWTARRR